MIFIVALCHGNKGAGQGNLVKREKILGIPSYQTSVELLMKEVFIILFIMVKMLWDLMQIN